MRGKLLFIGGLAVGYVLGSKAGRQRYEQIVARGRQVWESPTVQEAAGVVQAQATKLYDQGKTTVTDKIHSVKDRRSQSAATDTDSEGAWDTANRRAGFTANAF